MSKELHGRYLEDRSQQYGPDSCFICGKHIPEGAEERTVEHVFPKWLLKELNLWDGFITPINGTRLPYRKLTVPCCRTCNGEDLSAIEIRVKEAFQ